MTTSNIQKFDEITGRVFGALYENFPVPDYLLIKDFLDDGFSYDEHAQGDFPNQNGEFFFACVEWLSEAGYLRFKKKLDYAGFEEVVLTAKGLEALKAVPSSLTKGPSLGDQLVDATKSGTKNILGSLAGEVLSVGSRLVSAHLGLPV
ncbi:hypothetical protein [Pseudomonas sp. CC120222-01a]|uniref:hypothetical protein n=1 Tax=Pseudomonas sp. CC120222-01a TaxID=1378075 RepID=UPI000D8B9AFF|nr:hypothetical protein [Pseudomonas sp. CC120222-01a]PVZ43944.1 hypothetical protein N430_00426 [Pseudomonas sp. CC120222-01a]